MQHVTCLLQPSLTGIVLNSDQGTKVSNNAVFVDFPADTSTACLVFIVGRSYSGSSGDGGSAEASATMTSLHHPVQMATATTSSTDGQTSSDGSYFNGHRSSWGSSTISPNYPSSRSSPQVEHFPFRYSMPEHSLSQATPVVPTQEHGDFSASEDPNRGLYFYPRRM